ncbi:unnamed protein product [Candida verbasci]|uniref:B30.2/SPRY domain-containing protein n=1 Tax=Candida verbasci TaxID=1227364 RepID=A0A9W4U0S9_9ASCO|nr:unnamed protein product [Candida verbasci]
MLTIFILFINSCLSSTIMISYKPELIPHNHNKQQENQQRPIHGHPNNNNFNSSSASFIFISFIICLTLSLLILICGLIFYFIKRSTKLSEDEIDRDEENQAYLQLNSDEQELYFQSKEFLKAHPFLTGDLTLSQNLSIQEKGISAFEFQKHPMLTNNDLIIVNKTELNFFKNFECSTQTNLPIPLKNEVYCFEAKIYSLPNPEETLISIGLGIKPYPWFRLPGRHQYSISYDSDGYRRKNQPFNELNKDYTPPFPSFVEGDVIGVGYRCRSGTVFFTRNGKKISESKIGGHFKNFKPGQLFPTIGANNICSIHVNLGQRGFVFIEGNVKNWGFAPIEGNGPSPPEYKKFNTDILLERSEIDEDDLSDRENDFPPNFWSNGSIITNEDEERITLNSLPPQPPSYEGEGEGEGEGEQIDEEEEQGNENETDNEEHDQVEDDEHEENHRL